MQKSNHGRFCYSLSIPQSPIVYSSKQQYKEIADMITKTDEKSSYQISAIQTSIGNINTRLADLRDLVGMRERWGTGRSNEDVLEY